MELQPQRLTTPHSIAAANSRLAGQLNTAARPPNLSGDRLSVLFCFGAIAIGIIALTGYVLGNASIAALSAHGKPVSAVTALAFIALGAGLLSSRSTALAGLLTTRRAALALLVLAAADLLSAAFSADIEQWHDWASHGGVGFHPFPVTGFLILALAAALFLVTTRMDLAGHVIASAGLLINIVFLFAYALKVPSFLDPSRRVAPVAAATIGLALLYAAAVLARPRGWVVPMLARTSAGRMSRVLLPAAVGVPLLALALRNMIARMPGFTPEIGLTSVVVFNVLVSVAIVLIAGVSLHKRASDRARLASIVESSQDAIIGISSAGLIESWNAGAEQLYGYTAAEAIGRPVTMLAPPERQDESLRVFERMGCGERIDAFETVRVTKDGRSIDVWLSVSPVVDDADNVIGFSSIAHDITGRKKAEDELRASEEQYRTLFEAMDQGFCVIDMLFDPNGKAVDYRFVEINPAFERQSGLQQALGKTIRQMVPNHDSHWFEIYGEVCRTGEAIRFENAAVAMQRYFDVFAFRIGGEGSQRVGVLFGDITERKQNEQSLRDSEARYRQLFAANPHPMWIFDLETLAFLEVNDAAVARYGYRRDEFQAMTIADIRPSKELPRLQVHLSAVGNIDFDDAGTWRHRTKDGAIIDVEVMTHILDYDGRRAKLVLALDITERLRAVEALRDSEEALAEAQRIAQIGSWTFCSESGEGRGSAEAHRIFAIDPAPVIPLQLIFDRIHEEDRARVGAAIKASFHSGTLDEEARYVTPRGTRILSVSARKRETNEPRPSMIGTIQDITEMRAAEITLQQHAESLERYTADLERFNRLAVGRELRMIELKQQINDLCAQLGQPAAYAHPEERALAEET